ncbi:ABC transporter substrate-binding protein [Labrys monachus]|uniref:Branched-chain amino acid transport system substrate-binding protein n=1 Tax=Labrys monachus TaxID=217067 RepID=A0ABU0FND8_9HYPH|nr:ABC transporter substrate-binding protein [Labrys monachus]MDQ0396125.1 branched-chain amino acid transport system substrate-binding protein [Labrys monachus]
MTEASTTQEPIPIGSMVPLSGTSANDGREFRNGLTLAVDEINAEGGILGRPLRPVFIDSGRQTAEEVVRAARILIREHRVHAIINGYNIGPQNSEYEPIADAGVIYIHHNTLLQHHDTVASDPDRYFGCFMGDPAEYWYGQGFIKFLSWLSESGQWKPHNRRIAILSGPKPYSIVIANAMASASSEFGWQLPFPPRIIRTMVNDWRPIIEEVRRHDPAVLAVTQFHAGDLAKFHLQFMEAPMSCLVYLQYGALHRTFSNIVGDKGRGAIVGTVIGLPRDEMGRHFAQTYKAKFGPHTTPEIGCQPYSSMHHYAIAASVAGGTGGPGAFAINRRIAKVLLNLPYRSVAGTVRYHPKWQAAVPYPDATRDPSLGLPHLFYQLREPEDPPALIAPEPFADAAFELPPWL